jgi:dihydroorotate dehydrogenase (fumarate)
MEFATSYMGLALRNPLVASPSPLSYSLDGIRRLADGGVGAIVLFSLFEEQLREQTALATRLVEETAESHPEALNYFPAVADEDGSPRSYLTLLERAVAAVEVPVIASLNGVAPQGWADYARAMEQAGAAAIELNVYYLPGDPKISGREVEQRHLDVLQHIVMTTSALLRHGPGYAAELLDGLSRWMARKGFQELDEVRGLLAVPHEADATAYERAGYVTAMRAANAGAYVPW